MGLFQRVNDIISANLNEMVEKFEDPETMLKQAIREMESSIAEARREVVQVMASEKLVSKNVADNQRQARAWEEQATRAMQAGDERLARKALTRKQEHGKVSAALKDQLSATTEASLTLRRQLEAMQAKLAEAKRRLGAFSARKKAAAVNARLEHAVKDVQIDNGAFEKFDRLRQKVERLEAEADALRELDTGAEPEADVETIDGDLGIDLELEALKKKLAK